MSGGRRLEPNAYLSLQIASGIVLAFTLLWTTRTTFASWQAKGGRFRLLVAGFFLACLFGVALIGMPGIVAGMAENYR